MEYNTQRKKMELPEYGRSVQNMVDHALTIEDRAERQRCANTIINIMGGMFPHLRDVPDFKHKLWDHLAIMSDFKLDIDYPFEIVKKEDLVVKPEKLQYPNGALRYRHYGRFLEGMRVIRVGIFPFHCAIAANGNATNGVLGLPFSPFQNRRTHKHGKLIDTNLEGFCCQKVTQLVYKNQNADK